MKNTIINSTLALSTAFLLTICLHEIAHYLLAKGFGYNPILYHNRVEGVIQNSTHQLLVLAAGPLFSLIQGIIAFVLLKTMKPSIMSLFVLWFGIAGLITFFGYMMISPIGAVGDTGKIFQMLVVPISVQVFVALLSLIILTLLLMKSTPLFELFVTENFGSIKATRKRWAFSLILIPLLISIAVITLLQFPVLHPVSILATLCAPFSVMAIFGTFVGSKKVINSMHRSNRLNDFTSVYLITAFTIMILINRLLINGL